MLAGNFSAIDYIAIKSDRCALVVSGPHLIMISGNAHPRPGAAPDAVRSSVATTGTSVPSVARSRRGCEIHGTGPVR